MEEEKRIQLINDFTIAINKANVENDSNTPDFILANYLIDCLEIFNKTYNNRENWYNYLNDR